MVKFLFYLYSTIKCIVLRHTHTHTHTHTQWSSCQLNKLKGLCNTLASSWPRVYSHRDKNKIIPPSCAQVLQVFQVECGGRQVCGGGGRECVCVRVCVCVYMCVGWGAGV